MIRSIAAAMALCGCGSLAADATATEPEPTPDSVYLDGLKLWERIAEVLEPVKTRKDAVTAKPSLERLVEKMETINKTMKEFNLCKEEMKKLEAKYKKERDAAVHRFFKAVIAISESDPEAFKVLDPILSRLGAKK